MVDAASRMSLCLVYSGSEVGPVFWLANLSWARGGKVGKITVVITAAGAP